MRMRAMIVAAVSVCVCGCGTSMNLSTSTGDLGPKVIYGGVRIDAENAWKSPQFWKAIGPFWASVCFIGYTIDLPLSAVADTLTLPITVPATIDRGICRHYRINEFREQTPSPEEAGASLPAERPRLQNE
ncbi:MAG: YceK/YidQ family lipoprotein [Planctomycetaceae bacterium]